MGVLQCGANSSIVDRNGQANSPGQVVQLCACAWEWSGGVKDCRVICTIPYHNARSYAHLDRRESASVNHFSHQMRHGNPYIYCHLTHMRVPPLYNSTFHTLALCLVYYYGIYPLRAEFSMDVDAALWKIGKRQTNYELCSQPTNIQ